MSVYDESRQEDARIEDLEERSLPRATRRCADCGVPMWGFCVCQMEEQGFEVDGE